MILGWEVLEKEMTTHNSTLAWENPMVKGAWRAIACGVAKGLTQLIQHPLFHELKHLSLVAGSLRLESFILFEKKMNEKRIHLFLSGGAKFLFISCI